MLSILIAAIIIGALLYLLQLIPIDATVKKVIQVVAIVLLAIWLLKALWPMIGAG